MQTNIFNSGRKKFFISNTLFLVIFIIYLILRGYAWKQNIFLEDQDGIAYMNRASMYLNLEFDKLNQVTADSTPFYPLMTALFSLPGWNVEVGARLCSLFFSAILFLSLVLIGKKFSNNYETAIGLLLLTFSPIFIPFSFAVLTEPTYIGTIYLGFAMYMLSYEQARVSYFVLLGIIFGLAFLNRVEGIIFLAIIPLFDTICCLFKNKSGHEAKRTLLCNVSFVLVFLIIVSPQIYNVSSKMGRLALNGREVWQLILHNPDGKSYEEKLHGLTYSEKEVNLRYIQKHPEIQNRISRNITVNFKRYVSDIANEYNLLYQKQIGIMIGPFGLIFFTLGFVALYRRGNYFEIFFISSFIVFSLIPPLMHSVWMRHIAIVGPIMLLLGGIGIAYFSEVLSEKIGLRYLKYVLTVIILVIFVGSTVIPLRDIYLKNKKYDLIENYYEYPGSYREAVDIIKNISRKENIKEPKILTRTTYIPYYAKGEYISMPFTDYNGLVKYSMLNNIDFLYLEDYALSSYPFLKVFRESNPNSEYLLLYEKRDPYNRLIQLYRFIPAK